LREHNTFFFFPQWPPKMGAKMKLKRQEVQDVALAIVDTESMSKFKRESSKE